MQEACILAAQTLTDCELDLPFAVFYLCDESGKEARLTARIGIPEARAEQRVVQEG